MSPAETDHQFVSDLRTAIERYLSAVDRWEAAHQKYYRLPGQGSNVTRDLEAEQREYCDRRRDVEEMLPRARRLCLKHRIQEPFTGLLRTALGQYSPQQRRVSAISRNERNAVTTCLMELHLACQQWKTVTEPAGGRGSRLRRFLLGQ